MLTLDELKADVDNGSIDTIVVAFTDMQGRLLGVVWHDGSPVRPSPRQAPV